MEIYALCNWTISPFNDDLNKDLEDDSKKVYAFLTIPKDSTTDLLTTTAIDSYIICSCPIDAIQAIFPQSMLKVKTKEEKPYEMLLSKIVIDDNEMLKVVITKKNGANYDFVKSENVRPGELASAEGIDDWVTQTSTDLVDVNVTVSRDPPSCENKS
jgi:diphthamide synthase subunit DPH2